MNGGFIIEFFDFTKQILINKTYVGAQKVGVIFGFNTIYLPKYGTFVGF
jgi:hypothetical protein